MSFHLNPWYWITILGTPDIWVGIAVGMVLLYLLFRKKLDKAKLFIKVFVISLVLVFLLVLAAKGIAQVPRPCGMENPYCDTDYSMPSGHAATIFVFFTTLFLFRRKRYWLAVVPFAVAASRVALGVHTVADVLVGSLFGIAVPAVVWLVLKQKKAPR